MTLTQGAWLRGTGYSPAPEGGPENYIYFNTPNGTSSTGAIRITANGCPFTFKSLVLYSSVTSIPYQFTGGKAGATVYTVADTLPRTYGTFKTVVGSHSADVIDRLDIEVTNPAGNVLCCGNNPVGIAHIALNQ